MNAHKQGSTSGMGEMRSHSAALVRKLLRCGVIAAAAFNMHLAAAQAWKPQRNVEIVVTTSPGGSNDQTARALERILTAHKLVNSSLTVVNKPGGGGGIAYAYVNQHAGDAHYLLIGSPTLLSGTIMGRTKLSYTEFTPIVSLWNDYVVFGVTADSPIKTGQDLIERLKKDPQSLTIGFASAFGNHHHITAGLLMKAVGANVRDLKIVVFKGASEAVPALLGRHRENAVRKVTETAEWKADLETNYWSSYVMTGAQLKTALDKEYADMKSVLAEIGLAR